MVLVGDPSVGTGSWALCLGGERWKGGARGGSSEVTKPGWGLVMGLPRGESKSAPERAPRNPGKGGSGENTPKRRLLDIKGTLRPKLGSLFPGHFRVIIAFFSLIAKQAEKGLP